MTTDETENKYTLNNKYRYKRSDSVSNQYKTTSVKPNHLNKYAITTMSKPTNFGLGSFKSCLLGLASPLT